MSAAPTEPFATDATLTIGLAGEPGNWNPLAAPAVSDPALSVVADAVLPSAFTAGPGGSPVRNADLVTSATATPATATPATGTATATGAAPQTLTYEINGRAMWSDGVAVTAADFIYTWQTQSGLARFRDRGRRAYTPRSTNGYRQVASVTVAPGDPDRVVVRMASPDPDWRSLFGPILPAHIGRAVGFDVGFTDPVTSLVSAGPFLVEAYAPGRDVTLVRNPRWWGTTANLAAIDVAFVDSASEAAEGLEQGQLGAAATPFEPTSVAALDATGGLTVSVVTGPRYDDLVFDERSGPLAIRAVRLALMIAYDRPALVEEAVAARDTGAAAVLNRVSAPGAAGYREDSGVLDHGGDAPPPARAAALLRAAGFTRRGDTLIHAGTAVRLSLAVESSSPLADDEAAGVVAAGRAVGIDVTVDGSKAEPVGARAGRLDSMALVETSLTSSPRALTAAYGAGGTSRSGYTSTVMDGLLGRLEAAGSMVERNELLGQVDVQAWDDAVDLPLLGVPSVLAYQSRYVGLSGTSSVPGLEGDAAAWGIPLAT